MAKAASRASRFPLNCFENVAQLGGIETAVLDNGPSRGVRVAYPWPDGAWAPRLAPLWPTDWSPSELISAIRELRDT